MENLESLNFEEFYKIYSKHFTLGYLGNNMSHKLACIALTCSITYDLRKKNKNITCYDVLLKVGGDFSETDKKTFLKVLGALCEDFMYGCDTFPTFGVKGKDRPKQLKILLDNYLPF